MPIKDDECFIVPCLFWECIIFMEFIALNHGNFRLANTDIRECIIFTEFLRKTRRNNGNIRIKIFYRVIEFLRNLGLDDNDFKIIHKLKVNGVLFSRRVRKSSKV